MREGESGGPTFCMYAACTVTLLGDLWVLSLALDLDFVWISQYCQVKCNFVLLRTSLCRLAWLQCTPCLALQALLAVPPSFVHGLSLRPAAVPHSSCMLSRGSRYVVISKLVCWT